MTQNNFQAIKNQWDVMDIVLYPNLFNFIAELMLNENKLKNLTKVKL